MRVFQAIHQNAVTLCVVLACTACGQGDFDQRLRADIEAARGSAFLGINSNPATGARFVTGALSTGGPVNDARIVLYPVDGDGLPLRDDENVLGNGASLSFDSSMAVAVRRPYEGPIIVAALPHRLGSLRTMYANPALAKSAPLLELGNDEEILGYVLDFPSARDAVVISPLTTLVVERALYLGGISSGNLAIAAHQVGQFFGAREARLDPGNLMGGTRTIGGDLATTLAHAIIAQIAREASVTPAAALMGMRFDIRDDGELNGSAGLIPGSEKAMPDLTAANTLGTQILEDGWLGNDNDENVSGLNVSDAPPGSSFRELLDLLDTARLFSDTTLTISELSVQRSSLRMRPGQSATLGIRAFDRVNGLLVPVVTSDGPTVALLEATTDDALACAVTTQLRLEVSPVAQPGMSARITVRLRPDGVTLTGNFDQTVVLSVTVVN